jgi:hypothetical protein
MPHSTKRKRKVNGVLRSLLLSQYPQVSNTKFPLAIRLVNRIGEITSSLGLPLSKLSATKIMEIACVQTGLSDWGSATLTNGLTLLLDAFEKEANLNLIGRLGIKKDILRFLVNRLHIQELLKHQPEILHLPITRPLFIVGYPRTGTTLLHNLLAQDPAFRVPLLWELLYPFPPTSDDSDKRIQMVTKQVTQVYQIMPQFAAIHPLNPQGAEECIFLFQHGLFFHVRGHIPSYLAWLRTHDMQSEYQYYRQQLHVLQWREAKEHWVLKSPFHLNHLATLLAVFPDACIVQTHRDPQKLLPSWCSLVAAVRRLHSNNVALSQMGSSWLDIWQDMLDEALAVRVEANPEQFYDLHYTALMADPIASIERIYQQFHYPFSSQTADNMRRWLAENPQNKHGVHKYNAAQFGLTSQLIAQKFNHYMQMFNIKPE